MLALSSQENDQKRIRALKKANKERELKRHHLRELTKAKQEMAALRLEHQRLSAKLQDYSIFNKYLEKVVENSEVGPPPWGRAWAGAWGPRGTISRDVAQEHSSLRPRFQWVADSWYVIVCLWA